MDRPAPRARLESGEVWDPRGLPGWGAKASPDPREKQERVASQVEWVSGAPRDPLDYPASLAPQDLQDPPVTRGSSLKAPPTFSAQPSALLAPPAPQECRGSRDPPATKGSKERSARMARRAILAPLGLLASQALWGSRDLGDFGACQGRPDPQGIGVPLDSEGRQGSQEPRGEWVTEARGALRVSAAPRVTLAGLVPKASLG